jgi:hypothetical protein
MLLAIKILSTSKFSLHTLCRVFFIMLTGLSRVVKAASRRCPEGQNLSKQIESRRNLYVLGLPFTLTKYDILPLSA